MLAMYFSFYFFNFCRCFNHLLIANCTRRCISKTLFSMSSATKEKFRNIYIFFSKFTMLSSFSYRDLINFSRIFCRSKKFINESNLTIDDRFDRIYSNEICHVTKTKFDALSFRRRSRTTLLSKFARFFSLRRKFFKCFETIICDVRCRMYVAT